MLQAAPRSRFRDHISGPLTRMLGVYVALFTSFVMALTVVSTYLYQSSQLDHVLDRVLTWVVAEITSQAGEIDALATSPLLWNALADSKGRDAYLVPLLERFNRGAQRQFHVLDYRGRLFIAPNSQAVAAAAAIAADPIVAASVKTSRVEFGLRTINKDVRQILLVTPVRRPATDMAVGFIVAVIDLPALLSQQGVDRDLEISLALGEQPLSPVPQAAGMFSAEGSTMADGGGLQIPVRLWVGRSARASAVFSASGVLVALMLGLLMIHRVKAWAQGFATTITGRLDHLLLQCQKVLAGERLEAIEAATEDELSQVTQTLNALLVQHKKFADDLRATSLVFSTAAEGIMVTDTDGHILRANDALLAMTGYSRDELVGQRAGSLYRHARNEALRGTMGAALQERGRWSGETTIIARDRRLVPVSVAVARIIDDERRVAGNVAVITDITRLKEVENQLRDLANQDALTGLPNFRHMTQQVQPLLDEADGRRLGVLFVDLDNFKALNDQYGHAVGDSLIQAMAAHLQQHLPAGHLLCRRSGDEFIAVVSRDSTDDDGLDRQLRRLVPLEVATQAGAMSVTTTIGVSRFPEDAMHWHELQLCADVAMSDAKQSKRGSLSWYNPASGRRLQRQRQIQGRLREAIRTEAFEVHYQPELDLRDGRVVGLEALARWHDTELGDVSPAEFIAAAEETRVIDALTLCIADRVLRDKPALQARFPGAVVAFNASPQVFRRARLLEFLSERSVREVDVLKGLEIELTESEVSRIDPSLQLQVQALVGMGVQLVIDDFGTGYSSLSRLTQFPISRIKIDRSFVQGLSHTREARIARLIIDLAKVMGLEITAEGIETPEQRDCLVAMGCHRGQGWLFSRALPASALLAEQSPLNFPVPESKTRATAPV